MPSKFVKRTVSLAIHRDADDSMVLLVRRPEGDDEFPGMWGLPDASCRHRETLEEAASRIGKEKLGAGVTLGREIASGVQERVEYTIEMRLFEASISARPNLPPRSEDKDSVTLYTDWRWDDPEELAESAKIGSLCSRLLLESRRGE